MPRPKKPGGSRKLPKYCYQRGNAIWARFTVKGVEFRGPLRTSDAKVAGSLAKEWRDREIANAYSTGTRKHYQDAFIEWSDQIESNVGSAKTAARYATSLKMLSDWLKPLYLDEITSEIVKAIIEGRRAQGVTNATIKRDLTALSSLLEFHDVEFNPTLPRRKKVKERRDPIVMPTTTDIERVIARAPGNFAVLIRAAWLTGCRQNELVTAERRRLDHDRRELTVIGKGNKLRVIELSDGAFDVLRSLPAAIKSKWLFWHHDGQPYRNVASRFKVFVNDVAAQMKKEGREFRSFKFHHLRHRYAVDYLKAGGNIYDLQRLMGHSNISTTELYLKYLKPEEARRAKYGTAQSTAQRQIS